MLHGHCKNIGDVLAHIAGLHCDKPALVSQSGAVTSFGALAERVGRLNRSLHDLGVGKGARVAVLSRNRPEYLEVTCVSAGGLVAVPLNWRLSSRELGSILDDSQPEVIVADSTYAPIVDNLRAQRGYIKHFICYGQAQRGWHSYDAVIAAAPQSAYAPGIDPADTACIVYTSGTTGMPKGAELTHRGLLLNCETAISHVLHLTTADVTLALMPFFHVGGLWYHLFPSIAAGCTTFVLPEFDARAILHLVGQTQITNMHLVPTMLHALLNQPASQSTDLSSLRLLFYGASSMPASLLRRAMEAFSSCDFVQGYGSTEAGIVTHLTEEDHRIGASSSDRENLLLSCGRAVPGAEIKLVDPSTGSERSDFGELCVRSPMTMARYWQNPEATKAAMQGEWLRTGDLARADAQNYFYIVDRKSDMIVTGGENVYPREVEEALLLNPAIAEAAVFDLPDDKWVQKVVAAVVPRAGVDLSSSGVIQHIKERLAGYKCPKQVFIVDSLPRNAAGKVLRKHLRAAFDGSSGSP